MTETGIRIAAAIVSVLYLVMVLPLLTKYIIGNITKFEAIYLAVGIIILGVSAGFGLG